MDTSHGRACLQGCRLVGIEEAKHGRPSAWCPFKCPVNRERRGKVEERAQPPVRTLCQLLAVSKDEHRQVLDGLRLEPHDVSGVQPELCGG